MTRGIPTLLGLIVGCSPVAHIGVVSTSGSETSTFGSSTEAETAVTGPSPADTNGPLLDFGSAGEGSDPYDHCGKVDLLFVVDGSGSMTADRANLVGNVPTFVQGIEQTLSDLNDYHVGVIPAHEWYLANPSGCQYGAPLIVDAPHGSCGPYAEGHNYMTAADDLATAFGCAASLEGLGATSSAIELPMWALQRTVEKSLQGPGDCNEGFLRDDSLLVVVIITDEYDGPGDPEARACEEAMGDVELEYFCPPTSPGSPMEWFDAVVAARGGIESNIAVLSLVLYEDGPCPPDADQGLQSDGKNIVEFTEMFTHGVVGGLCEPDYGDYFAQAVDVVARACQDYQPPEG